MRGGTRFRIRAPLDEVIRHLHPQIKRKVRAALEEIVRQPECGKPLQAELAGLRSFRLGRFRVLYRMHAAGSIEIVAFGPRDRIYEETQRLLRSSTR